VEKTFLLVTEFPPYRISRILAFVNIVVSSWDIALLGFGPNPTRPNSV
jgi:hypothetical protein